MSDRRTYVSTVHHVAFRVDDMDAALEFYMGVLGCKMLPRPEGLPGARGAWLQCGRNSGPPDRNAHRRDDGPAAHTHRSHDYTRCLPYR